MTNIKNLKREASLRRKFLRERNLTIAFNRFKKIKRAKKFKLTVDGFTQNVVAFKKKDKIVVANAFTLRTIASTKRFKLKNIEHGFRKKQVLSKFGIKTFQQKISVIKAREIERVPFKYTIFTRRLSWLRKKVGKLYISVTFIGKRGKQWTAEGGSRSSKLLSNAGERTKAFNEAFQGALSKINFSYDNFIINWIHYAYTTPKTKVQAMFV